jgi:alpha-glucosidase (family GH31 glycosyl hydrolase)
LDVLPRSSVLGAQQALSERLGRPRLLPPYVFAPWNDAIFSEETVRDFATFLRERQIPTSVIWSEDWRGGSDAGQLYRLDEDWRLDRRVYPTYEDMAADLRQQGFVHQVYFNTFVTQGGDVYDEVTAAGIERAHHRQAREPVDPGDADQACADRARGGRARAGGEQAGAPA